MATGRISSSDPSYRVVESSSKTNVKVIKCNHRWTIENFSHCWIDTGEKLVSRTFGSEIDEPVKWCLTLSPEGNDEGNKDYLALNLKLVSSCYSDITVKFKFWILNSYGDRMKLYENEKPTKLRVTETLGCAKYVSRQYLNDKNNELLPHDNFTIYCEITASAVIPIALYCVQSVSADDLIRISYTWVIHDFSLRPEKTGQIVESPVFFSPASRKLKWKLQLYPNGYDIDCGPKISLYIAPASVNQNDVTATYKLSLINSPPEKVNSKSKCLTHTFPKNDNSGCGFPYFAEKSLLLDPANGFLLEDKLTIACEIAYSAKHRDDFADSVPVTPVIPPCRLLDDLESLFATKKSSDVTLVVGDRELQAHKTVLAARSSVFSAMFENKMAEEKSNRVEITDIDYDVLNEMLRFMYTGEANDVSDMAADLLGAAEKYDLHRLKVMCERELCLNLTVGNAANLFVLAHAHNAENLKTAAIRFIAEHRVAITATEDFKSMTESHPEFIRELLDRLSLK